MRRTREEGCPAALQLFSVTGHPDLAEIWPAVVLSPRAGPSADQPHVVLAALLISKIVIVIQ